MVSQVNSGVSEPLCQGPDGKRFQLRGPRGLCRSHSTGHRNVKKATDGVEMSRARLCGPAKPSPWTTKSKFHAIDTLQNILLPLIFLNHLKT